MKLKVFYTLIALACLHMSAGTLSAQRKRTLPRPTPATESNEKAWQAFVSAEGRFSALFPGLPEKSGQVIRTGVGSLPSFSFTLKTGMAEYIITYADFPSAFDDPATLKAAYDGMRDETISSNTLTLVGEREVTVGTYVGRHITAEARGELVTVRIVAANKRLYQVLIATRDYRTKPSATVRSFEAIINKFLDSFKLITSVVNNVALSDDIVAETGPFDLGRIEDHVYINDYLSFKVILPETWHLVERETSDAALQVAKEIVKGTDKNVNEGLDRSLAKTFVLFMASKFPLRTPNVTQAMLQCGVERLDDSRITERIYLEKNRDILLGSPTRYKLLRDVYPETIGGKSFFVMDIEQSAGGITVKQKYYGTIRKGLALFFITNYFDEEGRVALEKILQTVKFE